MANTIITIFHLLIVSVQIHHFMRIEIVLLFLTQQTVLIRDGDGYWTNVQIQRKDLVHPQGLSLLNLFVMTKNFCRRISDSKSLTLQTTKMWMKKKR